MANIITDPAVREARYREQFRDPIDKKLDTLPRKWCKTCERYLEDHPEINTDKYFGQTDTADGQIPTIDRLLEMREVPPLNSMAYEHRYAPGHWMHQEALSKGY